MRKSSKFRMRKPLALIISALMLAALIPFALGATVLGDTYAMTQGVDNMEGISDEYDLSVGEVLTSKTVTEVEGEPGVFEIKLEAIGRRFETREKTPILYDVVFVLDYSSSMDTNNKLSSMITASTNAINQIVANNTSELYNRVAVVKYNNGASTLLPWRSSSVTTSDLNSSTFGRTNTMSGMNQAYQLLNGRTGADAERPAIIVLMSDGQPNGYYGDAFNHSLTGTGSQLTTPSGQSANDDSVYYTVMCIEDIIASLPGLEVYTIGFDLAGLTGANQVDYAYATLYPEFGDTPGLGNLETLSGRLSDSGFSNPIREFFPAGLSADSIMQAFSFVIESIVYNDPIGGSVEFTDIIDDHFEIVEDSISIPSQVQTTDVSGLGVELKWTFANLETLDANLETGIIGDHARSTLTFRVRLKTAPEDAINETLYTNTWCYNIEGFPNENVAEFTPLSNNPFYSSGGGGADLKLENGTVRPYLLSTGFVKIFNVFKIQKEVTGGVEGTFVFEYRFLTHDEFWQLYGEGDDYGDGGDEGEEPVWHQVTITTRTVDSVTIPFEDLWFHGYVEIHEITDSVPANWTYDKKTVVFFFYEGWFAGYYEYLDGVQTVSRELDGEIIDDVWTPTDIGDPLAVFENSYTAVTSTPPPYNPPYNPPITGGGTTTTSTPPPFIPPEVIEEEEVPLGEFIPEEEVAEIEIEVEDVPLGEMPRTNIEYMTTQWFFGICLSMLAVGVIIRALPRGRRAAKKND